MQTDEQAMYGSSTGRVSRFRCIRFSALNPTDRGATEVGFDRPSVRGQ